MVKLIKPEGEFCLLNLAHKGTEGEGLSGRPIERLHFPFSLSCIGEGNATHSSVLAWRIPGTGEPGGLPSLGSHRVGYD